MDGSDERTSVETGVMESIFTLVLRRKHHIHGPECSEDLVGSISTAPNFLGKRRNKTVTNIHSGLTYR